MRAAGFLAGGIPGFNEDAVTVFVKQFMKHDDAAAMAEVCERMATSWEGRMRPSLGEVLDEYRRHPRIAAEREASTAAAMARTAGGAKHCTGGGWVDVPEGNGLRKPCPRCSPYLADVYSDVDKWERYLTGTPLHELHEAVTWDNHLRKMKMEVPMPPPCKVDTVHDPERIVDFADGMAKFHDEYRSVYGREMGDPVVANPVYAADVIMRDGTFDPNREVWHASYVQVSGAFRGDHARATAALRALGRRLSWDDRGKLTLRPPDEATPSPAPEGAAPPPPPPERPQDASGLLSAALGETRRRMEEQ